MVGALSGRPSLRKRVCAVLRHAERADSAWDTSWTDSPAARSWPHDPPLSENGLEDASRTAAELVGSIESGYGSFQVVVSSPYFRCVQTAVAVCQAIGPGVVLLLDIELGEIYGPDVMGEDKPVATTRPIEHIERYCRDCGVTLKLRRGREKLLGSSPTWPETMPQARFRFVGRFLRYLRRSEVTQRSFVIVTHAEGVATALSAMPSMNNRAIESIEFGGFFVAHESLGKSTRGRGCKDGNVTLYCIESLSDTIVEEVVVVDDGPLMAPNSGWSVKLSGIHVGRRVGVDFWTRIKKWSRKTVFSQEDIANLLRFLPERPMTHGSLVTPCSEVQCPKPQQQITYHSGSSGVSSLLFAGAPSLSENSSIISRHRSSGESRTKAIFDSIADMYADIARSAPTSAVDSENLQKRNDESSTSSSPQLGCSIGSIQSSRMFARRRSRDLNKTGASHPEATCPDADGCSFRPPRLQL